MAKEPETTEAPASKAVRVDVIHPAYGGVERVVDQPGSVIAFESAELYAKISGYLKTQNVDIGSRVKQGRSWPRSIAGIRQASRAGHTAAVDQAKAQVEQAQARVDTAKAERDAAVAFVKQAEAEVERAGAVREYREKQYERIKKLFDLKSIDERLVDEKLDEMKRWLARRACRRAGVLTAKAKVTAAEANVQQARADLVNAKAKVEVAQAALRQGQGFVEYTQNLSPYDGVVTKRNFFRGAFIRSAEQGGLVPLLGVSRTDLMRVVVQVPTAMSPHVAVGNAATVEIDALPGREIHGKVSRIADAEDPETPHHAGRDRSAEPGQQPSRGDVWPGRDSAHAGDQDAGHSLRRTASAATTTTQARCSSSMAAWPSLET